MVRPRSPYLHRHLAKRLLISAAPKRQAYITSLANSPKILNLSYVSPYRNNVRPPIFNLLFISPFQILEWWSLMIKGKYIRKRSENSQFRIWSISRWWWLWNSFLCWLGEIWSWNSAFLAANSEAVFKSIQIESCLFCKIITPLYQLTGCISNQLELMISALMINNQNTK